MKIKLKSKKIRLLSKRGRLSFAVLFLIFGVFYLVSLFAATPTAHFEAENSNLTGNASKINDSSASGSQAVKFNPPSSTPPPTSYPEPMWHADADTDVIDSSSPPTRYFKRMVTVNGNPNRFQIVNDPLGLYGKVYRTQLTPAELEAGDKRAELSQAYVKSAGDQVKLGVDNSIKGSTRNIYFGWRSMFGPDVKLNGSDHLGHYMQLKGNSDCNGPAISLTIKYNRLTLKSEKYLTEYNRLAWSGPLMSSLLDNKWHDIVMHVNFSKDPSVGYVEIWLDGVRQTMSNGQQRINFPTMCPNDDFVYPKMGTYAFPPPQPGNGPVHWFESPRIGTSYESVVPR